MTDTAYFPTDEIEQAPEDAPASHSEASKDLAFLGHVHLLLFLVFLLIHVLRYTFKRFSISNH